MQENCGFHDCPHGMMCCMNCDRKGNMYPTGQCVEAHDVFSGCPIIHCKNSIRDEQLVKYDSSKEFQQEKEEKARNMNPRTTIQETQLMKYNSKNMRSTYHPRRKLFCFQFLIYSNLNFKVLIESQDNIFILFPLKARLNAPTTTQAPILDDCPQKIREIQRKQNGKICPNNIPRL